MISIVIPVLNDDEALEVNLRRLADRSAAESIPIEIVVADGGPSERCAQLAHEAGAKYVASPKGRGRQMNNGATVSAGSMLLFLHADCYLPEGALSRLASLMDEPTAWGSFRHRIDAPHPLLRIIEWSANARARWLALPYGDQAIFCQRQLFESVGGFEELPLLEDVKLAEALGRLCRPVQLPEEVLTDPRRWLRRGILNTTWINWKIMWHYYRANRDVQALADLYLEPNKPPASKQD